MWVFLTAGVIALVVIYVYGFEQSRASDKAGPAQAESGLLPFQLLFRDLPASEQRLFREMQEGTAEAERLRVESGHWPTVAALATDGIPPFAVDPIDKSGLSWSELQEGLTVTYVGRPSAPGAPAFLVLIKEPDPVTGEKVPPPSVVDEEHQILSGGVLLHVTYWMLASARPRTGLIADPAMEGWQQIRVKSLLEELEQR
jgi:hypothetical protein